MADYYAVLKRTLDGLGETKPELRQKLYERARLTIGRQLESANPPHSPEALATEKANLENAIARIEQEFSGGSASVPQQAEPQPVSQSQPAPTSSAPVSPTPAPSAPVATEPVSEAPSGTAPAAPSHSVAQTQTQPAPTASAQGPGGTQQIPSQPMVDPAATSSLPPQATMPSPPPIPSRVDGVQKSSRTGLIVAIALVFLFVAGGGTALWLNRDAILPLFAGSTSDSEEPTSAAIKVAEEENPEPENASAPEEDAEKFNQRLTESGNEETTTPPIDQDALQPVAGGGISGDTEPSGSDAATPPANTPETSATNEPPANDSQANTQPAAVVAQKAFLYEEGADASKNTVDAGAVVWTLEQEAPEEGQPKQPVIKARVEILERQVVMIVKIKKNADAALPASHLVELVFTVPDDFSGGAIENVQRFVFKESEQARGEALIAVPAKIADGYFLIALNNLEQAVARNTGLMSNQEWIDIPLGYRTGRRALITLEKGVPGRKVFEDALAAWGDGTPAAEPSAGN